MNELTKNKASYLQFIIAGFIVLLILFTGYAFMNGQYYLSHEDEVPYYNAAKLFFETGSVRATNCLFENVSIIWQCDWYGPMYHILYGSIAKIFGFHNYNFLVTHLICFLIIIILILRANFTREAKLLIICSFLALHSVIAYIFTFFPETPELLFSVILTLCLYDISNINYKTGKDNKKVLLYVLLVLFFALFRNTTVFWVFGLLAFSHSKKDFFVKLGICVTSFLLIYMYTIYFNAPFNAGSLLLVTHEKIGMGTVIFLIKKFIWNVYVFAAMNNPFYDLLQVLVLVIAVYSCYISKNRFILAACIISLVYFLVLLTLYSAFSFFLNKKMACLYPLLLIAIFTTDTARLKYLTLSILLLFSPITYLKTKDIIKDRKKMAIRREDVKPLIDQFQQIKYKIEGGEPITILAISNEFNSKLPGPVFTSSLPVCTSDKIPILYTENFPINGPDSMLYYELNFRTRGKIHIDYMLAAHPFKIDSTSLIYSCNLFYLYKNNKIAK
ncbi:MAG: hypothetical protein ACLQQ4_10075 [Bacteroidia bacterium]